ncbi:MAG: hypothetical protein AAGC85_23095, partial [Bacteroidota bacterium]
MNTPIQLNGKNASVQICEDGVTLQAPGLTGLIEKVDPHLTTRSLSRDEQAEELEMLLAALHGEELDLMYEFEMEVMDDGEDTATRSLSRPEPINMNVPVKDGKTPIAVLHYDEAGIPQWIFPETATRSLSSKDEVSFSIPRKKAMATTEGSMMTRGKKKGLVKRIIRVISGVVGKAVTGVVKKYEKKNRPYGLNLVASKAVRNGIPDWDQFARSGVAETEGSTLLMIPGTFKNTDGSFGPLIESENMNVLNAHYGERIIAFDHPNLHQSPADNVDWLLDNLPEDRVHSFDLLTASRGGLVARELIRRVASNDTKGRKITINKALLVAACNQGTALANPENVK